MLVLDHVTAGYGRTTVLRDISMVVPPGAVVALLGPNGAGKTTLLRVASGLIGATSGRVLVDGTDLTGAGALRSARAGVCHVPEGRGVFPQLTVRENLLVQVRGKDVPTALERAAEAFPKLGQRLSQLAGTMSGGEQQMLALARAYVTNPTYVLLDEVSMGLAPKVVDEIFDFLRGLAERGCALLLVEQFVTRALELADYVYLLGRGEVSFAGEPGELNGEQLMQQYMTAGH